MEKTHLFTYKTVGHTIFTGCLGTYPL
jgi:hypothetical protein